MKGYQARFLLLVLTLFLWAILFSLAIINEFYGFGFIALLLAAVTLWRIYRLQIKTLHETKKLVDAIQYKDFSMGVSRDNESCLYKTLSLSMEKALTSFQSMLHSMESEQQYYNALLSTIDSGIIVVDGNGGIEWSNQAATDYLGKAQPRHISELNVIDEKLPQTINALNPGEIKVISFHKDGRMQELAITCTSFFMQGNVLKLVSLKNIHEALMEHELESWKRLIRVLTHEIMNSFAPIISLSETLSERAAFNEENYALMVQGMKTIHKRSSHLLGFIENYKKLSRIPIPVKEWVSVESLLHSLLPLLNSGDIPIILDIEAPGLRILADHNLLEQALINIIKNAIEACTDTESPAVRIKAMKTNDDRICITITDNGPGIDPAVLKEIFVPFFTTKQGGSGIGLSICRNIITLHGGTIQAASETGKGSCFEVVI